MIPSLFSRSNAIVAVVVFYMCCEALSDNTNGEGGHMAVMGRKGEKCECLVADAGICRFGVSVAVDCTCESGNGAVSKMSNETICRFCYQVPLDLLTCTPPGPSSCGATEDATTFVNCTVSGDELCFGRRTFKRAVSCRWTSGHSKTTATLLSITLGTWGVDRLYLGQPVETVGKLFSLGGLGIWTLLDAILIALGFITPAGGADYLATT